MAPAFSKEAILLGSIDHLCLVCESYLRTERDVCQHVSTAAHKRNLESTDYVENYRKDRVRKIKKWYFCEFCNVLISTITKVRLHVEESRHNDNITSQIMARVDDVIVFGNIVITEETWHGFIDDNTCTICNVEFEDKLDHRNEMTHIVNLIQSKVSNDSNNIYRKIDDSTFHCLTCNMVVATINTHFDDTNHKTLIQKCVKLIPEKTDEKTEPVEKCSSQSLNEIDAIEDNIAKENASDCEVTKNETSMEDKVNLNIDEYNKNHTSDDILDSIQKFQSETININFENRTAVCRRCSVNLEFDCKVIDKHIEGHKNNVQKKENETTSVLFEKDEENKTSDSEVLITSHQNERKSEGKVECTKLTEKPKEKVDNAIRKLVEEHNLTFTNSSKVFCQTCNKNIPSSVKNINEHVNGEVHKNKAKSIKPMHSKDNENKKINTKKNNLQRVPIQQFVRIITTIKNMFAEDVVINEKYCINLMAFTFLTSTAPGRLRCHACEVNLLMKDIKEHMEIERHDRALNEVPVIMHTDLEFIREIRSEKFHCGYCNIVVSWEGMENHLKTVSHKESKNFANWRLSQHLPQIEMHRVERQVHNDFLMRLMFS